MNKCPACRSFDIKEFYSIDNLPLLIFPVSSAYKNKIHSDKIDSFICNMCHHIFTKELSKDYADLIYGEYYKFYPYDDLETMNLYYRKPFEDFFASSFRKNFSSASQLELLEIGCSSGKQLEFFDQFNLNCNGIDPSPLNIPLNKRIISGLYQNFSFDKKYDIIVARFVLEHVNKLDFFLEKVYNDLSDNGVLYLQVPNILEFTSNGIPSFLAHEHSQYFNEFSMAELAETNNFNLVSIENQSIQSICVVFKKKNFESHKVEIKASKIDIYQTYLRNRVKQKNSIDAFLSIKAKKLCFYGSGLMLAWMIYDSEVIDKLDFHVVFDDNLKLKGKYFPKSNFIVKPYSLKQASSYETILLTLNPIYHKNIMSKLISDNYKGSVFALNNDSVVKLI